MNFWEIQGKKCKKKKYTKNKCNEFLGISEKKVFFAQKKRKKNVMIFWEIEEKSIFFVQKNNVEKKNVMNF